jgi:hypothetical protein
VFYYAGQANPRLGILEMLGAFLREAAVLIFVFAPLDQAIRGSFTFWFQFAGLFTAAVFLILGILVERGRYL